MRRDWAYQLLQPVAVSAGGCFSRWLVQPIYLSIGCQRQAFICMSTAVRCLRLFQPIHLAVSAGSCFSLHMYVYRQQTSSDVQQIAALEAFLRMIWERRVHRPPGRLPRRLLCFVLMRFLFWLAILSRLLQSANKLRSTQRSSSPPPKLNISEVT